MTYIPERDFIVRVIDLPPSVDGLVTPNDDGTFSIYLNANNPEDKQIKSYEHEVRHIINDDFYSVRSIEEVEAS